MKIDFLALFVAHDEIAGPAVVSCQFLKALFVKIAHRGLAVVFLDDDVQVTVRPGLLA